MHSSGLSVEVRGVIVTFLVNSVLFLPSYTQRVQKLLSVPDQTVAVLHIVSARTAFCHRGTLPVALKFSWCYRTVVVMPMEL